MTILSLQRIRLFKTTMHDSFDNLVILLQAQQMMMDTLGLAICVLLTHAVRHNSRLRLLMPLVALPIVGLGELNHLVQILLLFGQRYACERDESCSKLAHV